jgi:hypothetical protein
MDKVELSIGEGRAELLIPLVLIMVLILNLIFSPRSV